MDNVSDREICSETHKNDFANRAGQSGQALIEYVLVLIVVVSIVLGGMYQLSTAFQVWANGYFGEYLSCLLETGELPTLGSSTIVGECAQSYEEFSIANGRPLIPEGSSGPNPENQNVDNGSGAGENNNSVGSSGAAASAGISGGSSQNSGIGQSSRFRARPAGGAEGSGISREDRGGSGGGSDTNSLGGDGRAKRISLNDRSGYSRRYKDEDDSTKSRRGATNLDKSQGQKSGAKLIAVNRTVAQEEAIPDDEGMGFGGFLRYLLIAAILIALVLFFGGQLLQVSKSME